MATMSQGGQFDSTAQLFAFLATTHGWRLIFASAAADNTRFLTSVNSRMVESPKAFTAARKTECHKSVMVFGSNRGTSNQN